MLSCYDGSMRPNGTQKHLEGRRRRAIELLKKLNPVEVAKKIGCSLSSLYWWKEIHQKQGEGGLNSKGVSGRPSKLSKKQKNTLGRILLQGALKNGYSTDLWTTRRIAEVIKQRWGIVYHPNHIWRLLVGMGWSCQKPEKRAKQKNPEAIAHWKRYQWPHIKKRTKAWCPAGIP